MVETEHPPNGNKDFLPIPQVPPRYYGLAGNLPDLDPTFMARSIWRLADLYGPIFQLDLVNRKMVVVSSYELLKDVMDDDKFEKVVAGGLKEVRAIIKDGLFTAYGDEIVCPSRISRISANIEPQNWALAHRILMPVFGPVAIRRMFNEQLEIASQMILKWDRLGPENKTLCSDDFTKYFDLIGREASTDS